MSSEHSFKAAWSELTDGYPWESSARAESPSREFGPVAVARPPISMCSGHGCAGDVAAPAAGSTARRSGPLPHIFPRHLADRLVWGDETGAAGGDPRCCFLGLLSDSTTRQFWAPGRG